MKNEHSMQKFLFYLEDFGEQQKHGSCQKFCAQNLLARNEVKVFLILGAGINLTFIIFLATPGCHLNAIKLRDF